MTINEDLFFSHFFTLFIVFMCDLCVCFCFIDDKISHFTKLYYEITNKNMQKLIKKFDEFETTKN